MRSAGCRYSCCCCCCCSALKGWARGEQQGQPPQLPTTSRLCTAQRIVQNSAATVVQNIPVLVEAAWDVVRLWRTIAAGWRESIRVHTWVVGSPEEAATTHASTAVRPAHHLQIHQNCVENCCHLHRCSRGVRSPRKSPIHFQSRPIRYSLTFACECLHCCWRVTLPFCC